MLSVVAFGSLILAALAIAQSTVLSFISILGAHPDLVLITIIFIANKNGMMVGQVTGFMGGLVLDAIGLSPLGFYAAIYTLIGALFGITRGKMFIDPVLMPIIIGIVGVLLKGIIAAAVAGLFGVDAIRSVLFSSQYWIELGYTALVTPLAFAVLGVMSFIQPDSRKGEIF